MPAQQYEGRRESRVIAGMILSSTVIGKLSSLPRRDWSDPAMKHIDRMCCRFFEKNGKAPKKSIVDLFASWAEKHRYKDDVPPVERIIRQAIESDPPNSQLCIDEAMALFAENRATHGMKVAQGMLAEGKVDDALRTLAEAAEPVKAGTSSVSFPFNDLAEVKYTFAESTESIIKFDGGLGQFFGDMLEEDGFISFLAPQGRGKSYFLLEMAFTAILQRKKVAYFQVGDMTRRQVNRRLFSRAARWPVRSPTKQWPCTVDWPISMTMDKVGVKGLDFKGPLNEDIAAKSCEKTQQLIRSADKYLALSCHESFSISVNGMRAVMRELSRSGFDPAVVVLDYADNLAPVNGKIEVRHQLHQTWEMLRALSMEHHVLLITATQSNRLKHGKNEIRAIRMDNTSEDIRKTSAVTGLIGLGQNDAERRSGLYRLNWADKTRDQATDPDRFCFVASCLAVAHPAVLSIYPTYEEQRRIVNEKISRRNSEAV